MKNNESFFNFFKKKLKNNKILTLQSSPGLNIILKLN